MNLALRGLPDFKALPGTPGSQHGATMHMRPLAGWAKYRTPVRGLYLCGSGAHPGGGVMGAPGHNCAREILKDT
jgi:phytoene dehydrogenase-like protein